MSDIVRHSVDNVRKDVELEKFLEMVEEDKIPPTWELTAKALGVHPNTIKNWRKLPEFREAKSKGVEHALKQMEIAGRKDWKMWREKLNLLGATKEENNQPQIVLQGLIQINVRPD